ncbi:hypothetical protein NliqN6_2876 [Naganishia liquefaciens]|uniref:Uncharacterized protein n=1 Tax=Naganishia liquefaciens TaxID=104408 RepID=A0A8H3TSZ3_9TREE|nr:hypothetical protein NliqN6_2876 [Naganishia liquefaciens]
MSYSSAGGWQVPPADQCSYEQLQIWTGHPAAIIKCTIPDIYEAPTIRRNQAYAEPIFLLDQCPFRSVDVIGWISSIGYLPLEKDHADPALKMVLTLDDGNGTYVLSVSKTLKYELVDKVQRPQRDLSVHKATRTSHRRYLTAAERRKLLDLEKTTKYKRHIYPDVTVGDIVRIRGRVKEWSRRNGEVLREVVVDQEGSIDQATPWDEYTHFEDVDLRKKEIYNVPFQLKPYESMLAITSSSTSKIQATQTLTQKTQAVDFDGTASELTAFDPSDKSQVYSSSASQPTASLRHPCKLSRDHLNDSQFRRYLMEYLRIQTEVHWSADLESDQAIREAARYMPELAWPTQEISEFQMARDRQKCKQALVFDLQDDVDDLETTPKAASKGSNDLFTILRSRRRRPLTPVKFNGSRLSESSSNDCGNSLPKPVNCAFGLEHLVHVPHLRIFAHRFVRMEQATENEIYMRRRNELKAAGKLVSEPLAADAAKTKKPAFASMYKDSRTRRAERGWKMRKLLQHCFRLMVATDGSVIEVSMSDADKEAIRAEAIVRRAKKNSRSFEASYDSNGSLIGNASSANTTLGDASRLSIANATFDYSMWEAPAKYTGHPSDSDSSLEKPDIVKRILQSKNDPIGYLPLTLPVLGMAILHILHVEAYQRSRVYIPHNDRRKAHGLTPAEVWSRLQTLHERWERCQLAVVEDGMEDLAEAKFVRSWGEGWWPTHSRL